MNFEIFWPVATMSFSFFFVLSLVFVLLFERLPERIWSVVLAAAISVLIYVVFVGLTFGDVAPHHMPENLHGLFF